VAIGDEDGGRIAMAPAVLACRLHQALDLALGQVLAVQLIALLHLLLLKAARRSADFPR
jgi:hypothetical protein